MRIFLFKDLKVLVCHLWSWTRLVVDKGPLPLINFLDRVGPRRERVSSFVCLVSSGTCYIPHVCFGLSFLHLFSVNIIFFVHLVMEKKIKDNCSA